MSSFDKTLPDRTSMATATKVFIVETGDDARRVIANDWKQAIKIAWKKNPPKNLGALTRVAGKRWAYVDSVEALKIAGYKVQKEAARVLSNTCKRFPGWRGRLSTSGL